VQTRIAGARVEPTPLFSTPLKCGGGGIQSRPRLDAISVCTVAKLRFRREGGEGGDVEPLSQRPLSQARPAERQRFTE